MMKMAKNVKLWKMLFIAITFFSMLVYLLLTGVCKSKNGMYFYNISNLKYMINSDICHDIQPFLIITVPSHPNHTESRSILRQAYNQKFEQGTVRVVFLCGNISDPQEYHNIKEESLLHGDIIQGSFTDEYKSISLLHIMGVNWATKHCPQSTFVMESDDDIFVNIKFLLPSIKKFENSTYMYCDPIYGARPVRDPQNRYYVSYSEYNDDYYPTYCNGWSVVYPSHVAKQLIDELSSSPYFWMSDVFVSGILPLKIPFFEFKSMQPNYTWNVTALQVWANSTPFNPEEYLVGPTWGDNKLLMTLHESVGSIKK